MKLPISMCSSFAADYDGDDMTLVPLKTHGAIQECKVALWNNGDESPYREGDYNEIVPRIVPLVVNKSNTVALATTMCWTDRVRGHKATKGSLKMDD